MARAGRGERRIVLLAHYDSAKTFFLYHPRRVRGFRRTFLIHAVLATSLPLLVVWIPILARAAGVFFLMQAALLLHRERTAPYVNGANDNATGVAVAVQLFLEEAPRLPPGVELWVVLTGAEEVGARGARALLADLPPPAQTLVLNIDNVGQGQLYYAEAEGMLRLYRYAGPLVPAARSLEGAAPLRYRLAYFDTLPLTRAGYPCLTLIRLEGGVPPHWHWPTDTPDNVDVRAVDDTLAYARALLRSVLSPPSSP
ncbi:MAG: M28 family peptidase [Armatimonadota bacterium]|nr:M28 family peptidase [Armatimonadota bacterium]MDR7404268.1 M28 family peptidase [Armatimonadota bacterium]